MMCCRQSMQNPPPVDMGHTKPAPALLAFPKHMTQTANLLALALASLGSLRAMSASTWCIAANGRHQSRRFLPWMPPVSNHMHFWSSPVNAACNIGNITKSINKYIDKSKSISRSVKAPLTNAAAKMHNDSQLVHLSQSIATHSRPWWSGTSEPAVLISSWRAITTAGSSLSGRYLMRSGVICLMKVIFMSGRCMMRSTSSA